MKKTTLGLALTLGTLTAGTLLLAGCATPAQTSETPAAAATAATFDQMDIMFAEMMIPHHSQAVTMSGYAETNTTNPEVLALAKQIKDAQQPEITQMEKWLVASGIDPKKVDLGEHAMHMDGMLTDTQLAELQAAQGADFDKLYLTYMIQHHEGAISMARMVTGSANAEARTLGENIIATQQKEIDYMKQLLVTLGASK